MWATILGAVNVAFLSVISGVGYIWKRRIERQREQESIAIEQARLKFLTEASAIIEKLEPAARESTASMLVAALQNSIRALSEPPPASSTALVHGSGAAIAAAHAGRSKAFAESRAQQAKALAESQVQRSDHMRHLDDESRKSKEKYEQFWVDLYREPLRDVGAQLIVYAFESARRNAEVRNLMAFSADREVFEWAVRNTRPAISTSKSEDEAAVAKFDESMKDMRGAFKAMLETFDPGVEES